MPLFIIADYQVWVLHRENDYLDCRSWLAAEECCRHRLPMFCVVNTFFAPAAAASVNGSCLSMLDILPMVFSVSAQQG